MQIKRVVWVSMIWTACVLSLTSVAAIPSDAALQICQKRVEEELPETDLDAVKFDRGSELPNETVVIQWRVSTELAGYCRVATDDGAMVEFVNPYAVPRGQRPIENVVAFQTDDYTVRVVRLSEQLYMNVYNRRTDRVELNRELVRSFNSEEGTTYTNLLGQRLYRSIVLPDGTYRLVIRFGSRLVVYDQVGYSLANPEAAAIPTRSALPQDSQD